MLFAVLTAVNSYRIEDRLKSDLQALAQDVEEMEAAKDEETFPEKRKANNCKYPGAPCSNDDYSYGCRDIKTRCNSKGCQTTGVCWRQCYAPNKSWCTLSTGFENKPFICQTDQMCFEQENSGIMSKPAKEICHTTHGFFSGSTPTCVTSNPLN